MSETLDQFLTEHSIDRNALSRIPHRAFVIGRFNANKQERPTLHLFTNRPANGLEAYLKNFKAPDTYGKLSYDQFVNDLRPALEERQARKGRFAKTLEVVPQQLDPDEEEDTKATNGVVIDKYSEAFKRAAATAGDEDFLEGAETERGKRVFLRIRKHLDTLATFQVRVHELVDAASQFLGTCGQEALLPAYEHGGQLPGGFPEKLLNYLFAENDQSPFSEEDLDFRAGQWSELAGDRRVRARANFCKVVAAFRDGMLGRVSQQNDDVSIANHVLSEHTRRFFADERLQLLSDKFRAARAAFNSLRQVLRSRAQLSMVLEWLLARYYEIAAVTTLVNASDTTKSLAVESAILSDDLAIKNNLAIPVRRLTPAQRAAFGDRLVSHFDLVLTAVAADGGTFGEWQKGLNEDLSFLVTLAAGLRGRAKDMEELLKIASGEYGSEARSALVSACRVLILDVLLPTLFRDPGMDFDTLWTLGIEATAEVYMTAVALAEANKHKVEKIAAKYRSEMQKLIDPVSGTIKDLPQITTKILDDFFGVVGSADVAGELKSATDALYGAQTLLRHSKAPDTTGGRLSGAERILTYVPHPEFVRDLPGHAAEILRRTPKRADALAGPIEGLVRQRLPAALAAAGTPVITQVNPNAGQQGTTNLAVTITGNFTHFSAASVVTFSGKGLTAGVPTSATATSLTVPVTIAGNTLTGAQGIQVVSGGETVTLNNAFTVPKEKDETIEQYADRKIRALVNSEPKSDANSGASSVAVDLDATAGRYARELVGDGVFLGKVENNVDQYQKILFLIYHRYEKNKALPIFRRQVERLTLINLMLVFHRELGLGDEQSSLYQLLLDLVELAGSGAEPDLSEFMRTKSLTEYFSDLKDGGIGDLKQLLKVQATDNLTATAEFMSDLQGVKYLMDRVSEDRNVEIIVVNATAKEFMTWIVAENHSGGSIARLRSGSLVTVKPDPDLSDRVSDTVIPPGLIVFSDSAFNKTYTQSSFLRELSGLHLANANLSFLLPPMCVSTLPRRGEGDEWARPGEEWARLAAAVPAPLFVVGPSPLLNHEDDIFRTHIPAGYLFAVHFLGKAQGKVRLIRSRTIQNKPPRFGQLGEGTIELDDDLETLFLGTTNNSQAFAADFYLYIVLTVFATAIRRLPAEQSQPRQSPGQQGLSASVGPGQQTMQQNKGTLRAELKEDYFKYFFEDGSFNRAFFSSKAFDSVVWNNIATHFATNVDLSTRSFKDLGGVRIKDSQSGKWRLIGNVEWFWQAIESAGLAQ